MEGTAPVAPPGVVVPGSVVVEVGPEVWAGGLASLRHGFHKILQEHHHLAILTTLQTVFLILPRRDSWLHHTLLEQGYDVVHITDTAVKASDSGEQPCLWGGGVEVGVRANGLGQVGRVGVEHTNWKARWFK